MFKRIAAVAGVVFSCGVYAFTPQSGTWVINGELNGAPGRGLAIDVQENTLLLQMYAYERSGEPTFYMASGSLENNRVTTTLGRYSGGRYLGSGPMSGREDGSPGNVTLRFTSGISGFITLPGEGEVPIKRFEFALSRTPAAVAGTWVYVGSGSDGEFGDLVTLSRELGTTSTGTGFVADAAGQMGCEYRKVDEGPYNMYCGQVSGNTVTWIARIRVVGNEGEGISLDSNGRQDGIVYLRKLRDSSGRYLGLFAPEIPRSPDTPAPAPAVSPYAGSYSVSGGGVSVTFSVNSDGGISRCSAGVLVTCSGRVNSNGSFSLAGNDGDGTTVTLTGSITSSGQVVGTFSGTSDGEPISGSFTGFRSGS